MNENNNAGILRVGVRETNQRKIQRRENDSKGKEKSRGETNVGRGSFQHWSEYEKEVGVLNGRKRMGKTKHGNDLSHVEKRIWHFVSTRRNKSHE